MLYGRLWYVMSCYDGHIYVDYVNVVLSGTLCYVMDVDYVNYGPAAAAQININMIIQAPDSSSSRKHRFVSAGLCL